MSIIIGRMTDLPKPIRRSAEPVATCVWLDKTPSKWADPDTWVGFGLGLTVVALAVMFAIGWLKL